MSLRKSASIGVLAIGCLTGCPTPQQQEHAADYRWQAQRGGNGLAYQGIFTQGVFTQGVFTQGTALQGIGTQGTAIQGTGTQGTGTQGTGTQGTGTQGTGTQGTGTQGTGTQGTGTQGTGTQGTGTQGSGISGSGISATGVVGLSLLGVTYTGSGQTNAPVTGLYLQSSELFAVAGGQTIRGSVVAGLEFHYSYLATGATSPFVFTLRVDAAGLDPTAHLPPNTANDVWMYSLMARQDNVSPAPAWQPACYTEGNVPDQALMLSHRWDLTTGNRLDQPNFITFACRDYSLGKCARMGYRPWAKAQTCTGSGSKRTCTDIALTDHHQSCVRMMRADYCGNGKSYTVNGTLIDIYDYLNPPLQVPETDWDIEARWTPTGAICLNDPRHPELVGKWKRPDCNGDGKPDVFSACGQSDNRYSGKGLVVNRFNDDQSGCGK
jgi:hypothetical protein